MDANINGSLIRHAVPPDYVVQACLKPDSLACRAAISIGICSAYVAPLMASVGLLTNSITAWIFLIGLEKYTRQFVFLGCLAIADNLRLTQLIIWQIPAKGITFLTGGRVSFIITNVSEFGCIFFRFHHTFTGLLMSHIFLLTSLDRFLTLRYPNFMSQFGSRSAWFAMTINAALALGIAGGWASINGYNIARSIISCWIKDDNIFWAISNIFFFQARALQISIINIINLLVIYKVVKFLRNRSKLQEGQTKSKLQFKQIKASIMIFWIAVLDFLVNVPMIVIGSIALGLLLIGEVKVSNHFFQFVDLFVIIADLEACTRWLVYICQMNEFRSQFFWILTCGRKKISSTKDQ